MLLDRRALLLAGVLCRDVRALAWTARRFPPPIVLALLTVVALVQYVEGATLRGSAASSAARVNPPHFVDAEIADLAARADRLFVYPSHECTRDDPEWPHPESWRAAIVELLLTTSKRALPSNSAYVNRGRKDCEREARDLPTDGLVPGTLYVVRRADVPGFLAGPAAGATCRTTDLAFVCLALSTFGARSQRAQSLVSRRSASIGNHPASSRALLVETARLAQRQGTSLRRSAFISAGSARGRAERRRRHPPRRDRVSFRWPS
jgi:hypothetical protein